MSRLVVVSNRVADLDNPAQSGGLAVAVGDALRASGGLWFGWDGETIEGGGELPATQFQQSGNVTIATISLSERDYEDYYLGFSNRALWPVFHYRLDLAVFETDFVIGYRRVNATFADRLTEILEPDDEIWVQDYHLVPLAAELRARGHQNKIGFFLHIPFPPPDVLVATPEHDWLLRSLFAYDLVGVQTQADLTNIQRYVVEQASGDIFTDGLMTAYGRRTIARSFPIGIDVEAFEAMARSPESEQRIALLHRRTLPGAHIIGVDRLDYTKGLPERLKAFRRFLELHPESHKAATLMQIAPPTREEVEAYADIRQELEGLSGEINGAFGDFDWTPVRYIHRSMPRETLASLFRGSQVGLVTPLRDGMNLVAKEYVVAQRAEDPGVLVLSRFAGAAEDLQEALIVNPYDADEMASAIQSAIVMSLEERRERHNALMVRVRDRNVKAWRESFLEALRNSTLSTAA